MEKELGQVLYDTSGHYTEPQAREFGPSIQLPEAASMVRTLDEVFEARTSVRHFAPKAIGLAILSTLLESSCIHNTNTFLLDQNEKLSAIVLAQEVDGLDGGAYAYDPDSKCLHSLNRSLSNDQVLELFVQSEFATAPLIVWLVGDLARACAAHGAFGHRKLLLGAGFTAQRLWNTALGLGLGGCITAGLIPGTAKRLLGFDGYHQLSLVAFATGYERTPSNRVVIHE
jgi:SagB-type dehydrogenase family enzyme